MIGWPCENLIDESVTVDTATVSPKYQIVIPKSVRGPLRLSPGQKVQVVAYDNRIELIPLRPARSMRGSLEGIDTEVPREDERV